MLNRRQRQMCIRDSADPDLYERPEEVHRLAEQHDAARARADRLLADWESALAELESSDA